MTRTSRSSILIAISMLCVAAWLSPAAVADSLNILVDPQPATTNSIRNFVAVWQRDDGREPVGLPDIYTEGWLDYNPTIGVVRPLIPGDGKPTDDMVWFPEMPNLRGFNGFLQPDPADPLYNPDEGYPLPPGAPSYVWLQPDPAPTIGMETDGDPKYDHGMDFMAEEYDLDDLLPGIAKDVFEPGDWTLPQYYVDGDGNPIGLMVQRWIPAQDAYTFDPGTPDDPSDDVPVPDLPDMIVLPMAPLWVTGVWADQSRTKPIKARVIYLSELIDWFPDVRVIVLPDGVPAGYPRVYVSYYYPGTDYLATQGYPLPMPYTVYPFSLDAYEANPQQITELRINPAILSLDPGLAPTDPADPTYHTKRILGVFDNPGLTGTDYYVGGDYEAPNLVHPDFGIIHLNTSLIPGGAFSPTTTLYIKISTSAVDNVYDNSEGQGTDYFADTFGNARVGSYCSKSGVVKLGQPLPTPVIEDVGGGDTFSFLIVNSGAQAWVNYRPLSRTAFTVGRPRPANVQSIAVVPGVPADQNPDPKDISVVNGHFLISGTKIMPLGTYGLQLTYRRLIPENEARYSRLLWISGLADKTIPMYWVSGSAGGGMTFRVAASAGLNMSNPKQWPSPRLYTNQPALNNKLLYDPRGNPMWYAPALVPNHGHCNVFGYTAAGDFMIYPPPPETYTVNVVGSRMDQNRPGEIDYGGFGEETDMAGRNDTLSCYPDSFDGGGWPQGYDVDPLSVEPIEEMNPSAPDSGSSSTQFVFRARYSNDKGLPPKPWLSAVDDPWSITGPTGVVLYIDFNGTGDYKPHFMAQEKPEAAAGDPLYNVYIYRMIPHHYMGVHGNPPGYPWQTGYSDYLGIDYDNYSYTSLAMGTYHYFFACSDDSLTFDTSPRLLFANQAGQLEWGQSSSFNTRYSTGLDPTLVRSVTGYEEVARTPKRKYSADGGISPDNPFDYTIYVDRQCRVPGFFETYPGLPRGYPWPSSQYPEITCELRMPSHDDKFVRFDDVSYGAGRFFGTVNDYRRMSNPSHRGTYAPGQYAARAETCGHESSQENVFRVLYKSKYNEAPISIKVYINNASEKNNPEDGDTPAHTYTAFSMNPRPDQVPPYNYVNGVWYEFKTTTLARGPHTYYFQANDGRHVARYPVRPDEQFYRNLDGSRSGTYNDWWVDSRTSADTRGTATYYDNDYFPGPYVNNPCVLSEATVTPGTGKEGQQFKYRVRYSDPDGQRVYSANIIIEINDKGDTRRFAMVPEVPIVPPTASATEAQWQAYRDMWKTGVYFVLNTATVGDLALQPGVRRYRFEFRDDWGRLLDVNDTLRGELTIYPQGAGNWISGPIISANIAPTLYRGSVESQDGTANAATLWTWRVTYRDVNNDEPKMIKLYMGLLQADGRTIVWDEGHTLQKSDPSDMVYSDGAEYYFQTRLGAVDAVLGGAGESKQYYYAFEAFDGGSWAAYKSSTKDEQRSNAAGCMFVQNLEFNGDTYPSPDGVQTRVRLKIRPKLAQQGTVAGGYVTPSKWDDILVTADGYMVDGVYLTEDLTGTNYLNGAPDIANKRLPLAPSFPVSATKAWIKYEAQSPVVGPLPVQLPAPVGVIPDALVYDGYLTAPVPILIDDQKNGWISETDPHDRSVLVQRGLAMYQGLPDKGWVIPERPEAIGSVEGIYLTLEDALDPETTATNYYDISRLDQYPAIMQTWRVNTFLSASRRVLTPISGLNPSDPLWSDPTRINKVMGVFTDPDITTAFNYYQGNPTLDWQPALVVGSATVWPTNPNEICSIEGVHLAMDQTLTNYWNADRVSVQGARPQTDVLLSNPDDIDVLTGIFLDAGMAGQNYYDPAPYAGEPTVHTTTSLPVGTANVTVSYVDFGGNPQTQVGTVYIQFVMFNDPQPIQSVMGVFDNPGLGGTNYFDPDIAIYPYGQGNLYLILTTPMTVVSPVYVSYMNLGFRFGEYDEYLALTSELPLFTGTAYVAYHAPGDVTYVPSSLTNPYRITLATAIPDEIDGVPIENVLLWIRPDTYKSADPIIRTTYDMPISDDPLVAQPSNPTDIGLLTGMFLDDTLTGTNYYDPGTAAHPYNTGDRYAYPSIPLPTDARSVVLTYLDLGGTPKTQAALTAGTQRTVYVRYSHTQYTHQIRGKATQPIVGLGEILCVPGTTHFTPDGWDVTPDPNVHINSNELDPTAGMIGVWLDQNRSGLNFHDPRRTGRLPDDSLHLRISTPVPDLTFYLWARTYQNGDYFIDRWNREVVLLDEPANPNNIQATYFFGTKMPMAIGSNTPPKLEKADPAEAPISESRGSRSTSFTFSIKYSDPDGPNGQAPAYVRVYIDGVPHNMTPAQQGGTPTYNAGAIFTYTTTLPGGSHKYHFECSDGAAVAWFDFSGGHQSYVGTIVDPVVDLDGPWVNDPPTLTGISTRVPPGYTNPGLTPVIGTNNSVDYFVTYTDLDGDAPYFHDPVHDVDDGGLPLGAQYDGSPRLWIDTKVLDNPDVNAETVFAGTVSSIQADPLDPTRYRQINVSGTPGWTPGVFDAKPMQMTGGAAVGRVYLIQSNTTNTLIIATDDLNADGIKPGDTFRINALLMSKVDPGQVDFTQGVDYKITVPRLAVGTHDYCFLARSREDKPQWLKPLLLAEGLAFEPFSKVSRWPSGGVAQGPKVEAKPPADNKAPGLLNSADSSLHRGPKVMHGSVTSAALLTPSSAAQVKSVISVHFNANEADGATGTNYYNPAAGDEFIPGDPTVDMIPSLPAVSSTATLVQAGRPAKIAKPDGSGVYPAADLWNVKMDAPDRIGSVDGVYLITDPTMTGTNYCGSIDPFVPAAVPADSVIPLTTQLPVGTERVYIKYGPRTTSQAGTKIDPTTVQPSDAASIAGVLGVYLDTDPNMTGTNYYDPSGPSPFVPGAPTVALSAALPGATTSVLIKHVQWPPLYIRHYGMPSSPNIYLAGEPLTFRVQYRDDNGDPPTWHDGVQGYVRTAIGTPVPRTAAMAPLVPPDLNDPDYYMAWRWFTTTLSDVASGSQPYYFTGHDGYVESRYPLANTYPLRVNFRPVLSNPVVDHTSGATTFTFGVKYVDGDNVAPTSGYVLLRLTKVEDPHRVTILVLTKDPATSNYATGVNYIGALDASILEPDKSGHYTVTFEADDGIQAAAPLDGLPIVVRDTNIAPVIKSFTVSPTAGKTTVSFTYSGFYRDGDGDGPVYVHSDGRRVEGLKLTIDKDTASEKTLLMTRVTAGTPDYATPAGVEYRATLSGRQLGAGQHTYLVTGSDGTSASTELMTGTVDANGADVTPQTASIIESMPITPSSAIGVYTDVEAATPNFYLPSGTFSGGKVHLGQPLAPGTGVYVRYNRIPKSGPVIMVPYFDLSVVTKDGIPVTDRTVVGEEVLIEGQIFFPYNLESGTPSPFDNVTIQVTKPDGTSLALNARVESITLDNPGSPQLWVGDLIVRYDGYVDPALASGDSLTLTASGIWKISAIWPGDAQWDEAATDTTIDGRNDSVQISVGGPSRTLAVSDPLNPDTSAMLVDMITPPMVIGSNDPGVVFGHDRAEQLRIVRWSPTSGMYFSYGVGGVFPPLMPGDAVWIKPKSTYPAAEPLGVRAVQRANVQTPGAAATPTTPMIPAVIGLTAPGSTAAIYGVYLNQNLTGVSYYNPKTTRPAYTHLQETVTLASNLPTAPAEVWVDYVIWPLSGVDEGWTTLDNTDVAEALVDRDGNLGTTNDREPRYYHTRYRLVKTLSKSYPVQTDALGNRIVNPLTGLPLLKPCLVSLKKGWNQFGNIFFNWHSAAQEGAPREDDGIPISEVRVIYLGQSKTLGEAKLAGWVNDYAWRWDATQHIYVRVHATAPDAEKVLRAWSGYWIRAFVDCELEINPNTSYHGATLGLSARSAREATAGEVLDMPPPAPD